MNGCLKAFLFLLLPSGLLSYVLALYAQSKQSFPNFFPNYFPDRNLRNVFLITWFCLAFLGIIIYSLICHCCCSSRNNARAKKSMNDRSKAYNPQSKEFNPSNLL